LVLAHQIVPDLDKFEARAYCRCANGAHDLARFWTRFSQAEMFGLRHLPVEAAQYNISWTDKKTSAPKRQQ
jgi:hypothetical protein